MSSLIDTINAGALVLRKVREKYKTPPANLATPFSLSKTAPYYGFVDVNIGGCPPFAMFSNNDDFVAKYYFWNGPDAYEPMSLKLWLVLAKSSSIIFDIGAYTGVYSLAAAIQNKKSKVYTFEALDTVYSRLVVNKTANNLGNITLYHAAMSDSQGIVDLNVYAGDGVLSSGSSMEEKQTGRSVFVKKTVKTVDLDHVVTERGLKQLNLIKIDAEGSEHLIFEGGQETIRMFKPDIICEFLPNARTVQIEQMLSSLGYRYFQIHEDTMQIVPVNKLVGASGRDTLNTLITTKSPENIQKSMEALRESGKRDIIS